MPHRNLVAALALLAFIPVASHAQDRGYPAAPLLSTGTSIVGETLRTAGYTEAAISAMLGDDAYSARQKDSGWFRNDNPSAA